MSAPRILSYEALADPPGIELIDRLEQLRCRLHTPNTVTPTEAAPEEFVFPVGKGLRVETGAIVLPNVVSVFVRDSDGRTVEDVGHLDSVSLPDGEYVLDLSTQIKTYVEVSGPVEVTADVFEVRIEFDPQAVQIGFRSRHTRPAATITTTEDPLDMMAAVSHFGSALKTTSPERAFPTLRGHPPRVELGSSLSVPTEIEQPETGVQIEIPPSYGALYPVAPLAYYLGARVEPGPRAKLITEDGLEYSLDEGGYEQRVSQTLEQLFLLDCLTRTEGYYDVALHERAALAADLDLDFRALYDRSLASRLPAYLDIPYDTIAEQVPEWRLSAHAEPVSESVEQLPFVVNELATVRTATATETVAPDVGSTADGGTALLRSSSPLARDASPQSTKSREYVQLESTDALEQGWIGSGVPIGASKLLGEAFENRLDRSVSAGDISITIIVNDTRMDEERDLVNDAYGDRENLPFDIDVFRDLSVDELGELLREDHQFLHYIGHTEADGFECVDGNFDAGTLDETGVEAFLLNACNSYEQGVQLIEAGAIGGIVTLNDISNSRAVRVGELIAQLLNIGFPLSGAVDVASDETILGKQYIVVGDGGMTVTQAESRTPALFEVNTASGQYEIDIQTYITNLNGMGALYRPHIESHEKFHLVGGSIGRLMSNKETVSQFLDRENTPVRTDDTLCWSRDLDL
jgi:hypothetical protein